MKQTNMPRIAVVTLTLFMLLLDRVVFSANVQTAHALPLTTATCTVKWRLPQSICNSSENCSLRQKISENGHLYAFNPSSGALVVLKPDGQIYGTYDMAVAMTPQNISLIDYVPFGSEYILFMSLEGNIYKYTLNSRTLAPVTFQRPTQFLTCSGNPAEPRSALSRVGQSDNILACLKREVSAPELLGIDLVTFNQASSITTIDQSDAMRGGRAWLGVVAGEDGFIYLQPNAWSFPTSFLAYGDYNVVTKYNLQTQQWSIIRLPPELNVSPRRLALVDGFSNLYFEHYPFDATTAKYRLTKVNASGQIIWQITEQDVGSSTNLIGVSSNGNPILNTSSQTDPAGLVQECAVTSTGTPSPTRIPALTATVAPTLTPGG